MVATKLVVNPDEAERVREIFELYLNLRSLTAVARDLNGRGWRTKEWHTKKGLTRGGKTFDKTRLWNLLTNPVYTGKVRHRDETFDGEHEAIVADKQFVAVQKRLGRNGTTGGKDVRNKYGALLRGLVRCKRCDCAMAHSYTTKGKRRYRYYVCTHAQKVGWKRCPAPSIPAEELEQFVVGQIRDIGRDPTVVGETVAAVGHQTESRIKRLRREQGTTRRKLAHLEAELAQLATAKIPEDTRLVRFAEVQEQSRQIERRLSTLR